ncbi:VVA0879 family protein [Gemmatimonas sp.]
MGETMTHEAFLAEARRRFGDDPAAWCFVCPSCGHVASVRDWREAGAPNSAIGFSCVGRWSGGDDTKTFMNSGGPCQYAGAGLFRINPVTITGHGEDYRVFALAPQREGQG